MIHYSRGRFENTAKLCLSSCVLVTAHNVTYNGTMVGIQLEFKLLS